METWQKNQLREMQFINSGRALFNKISAWSAELGFEFCSFAIRTPIPISNPTGVAITNYPDALQHAYQNANYVGIDPMVHHALSAVTMQTWTDDRFSRVPEVWHEARTAGLNFGVSQPTRGTHGLIGLLSLSRHDPAISEAELEDKKHKLLWLANAAHQGLSPYLVPDFISVVEAKLTERELSVLRWTAEGKTSAEIADIIKIKERTVNFHINNAVAKLGTTNRTAATVQAAMLGLLE